MCACDVCVCVCVRESGWVLVHKFIPVCAESPLDKVLLSYIIFLNVHSAFVCANTVEPQCVWFGLGRFCK